MAKGKAPELDGITAEVLIKCWSFMEIECVEMVQKSWDEGGLSTKALMGVIKLFSKGGMIQFLKD